MEYIHTTSAITMIFWLDMGIMQLYPFMSLLSKNGCQYADGGWWFKPYFMRENGACEIDVIILEEENRVRNNLIINQFSLLFRILRFMNIQNGSKDLIIGN
jgi:hypothetical protein